MCASMSYSAVSVAQMLSALYSDMVPFCPDWYFRLDMNPAHGHSSPAQ